MSNARVRFEVVRHAIQYPKRGLEYIPRTPGVIIEVTFDLGDEIQARELLESSIGEARVTINEIVASTEKKHVWSEDQVLPADTFKLGVPVSFIHPEAMKNPPADDSWLVMKDSGPKIWPWKRKKS